MYAIVQDGSRQYKVSPGDIIDVDLRELGENQDTIEFDRVLMVSQQEGGEPQVGTPTIAGAKVVARIANEIKADKIHIYKHRRRKGYHRKQGHRQRYLRVAIEEVVTE